MTTDSLTPYEDIILSYKELPLMSLYMLEQLIQEEISLRQEQFGESKHTQGLSVIEGIQVDFPVQIGQNGVNSKPMLTVINGGLQ